MTDVFSAKDYDIPIKFSASNTSAISSRFKIRNL